MLLLQARDRQKTGRRLLVPTLPLHSTDVPLPLPKGQGKPLILFAARPCFCGRRQGGGRAEDTHIHMVSMRPVGDVALLCAAAVCCWYVLLLGACSPPLCVARPFLACHVLSDTRPGMPGRVGLRLKGATCAQHLQPFLIKRLIANGTHSDCLTLRNFSRQAWW